MAIFNLESENIIDLQLKLNGKLPVNRDELLALANSWGRNDNVYTLDKDGNEIKIEKYIENKRYNLSKLDVSEIKNFNSIFKESNFNDNISSWDVSKATSMFGMFYKAKKFNSPLDKWDTSKVTNMYHMFSYTTNFNQNINFLDISKVKNMDYMFAGTKAFNQPILWDLSKVESCDYMLHESKAFLDKFNNGIELRKRSNNIKKWLNDNQERMIAIDVEYSKGKELDNFLSNLNVIDSANLNGLHNNEIK